MLTKHNVSGSEDPSFSSVLILPLAIVHGLLEPRPESMKQAAVADMDKHLVKLESRRGNLEVQ